MSVTHLAVPSPRWPQTACGLSGRFLVLLLSQTPSCPSCMAELAANGRVPDPPPALPQENTR